MAAENLVSLDEVRTSLGDSSPDEDEDARYEFAIRAASAAIRSYAARDFGHAVAEDPAARSFYYDGTGFLEIDDAIRGSITLVTLDGVTLTAGSWVAEPDEERYPVHTWLELPASRWSSPAMGFTRNEDIYRREHGYRSARAVVTAIFGWPSVPDDVKMAAILTVASLKENPHAYVSESIAGYSRTSLNPARDAIPERAKDLLEPYVRTRIA